MEKKRGLIQAKVNTNEIEIIENLKSDKNLKKYIDNKKIKKQIFIKNKLINILL